MQILAVLPAVCAAAITIVDLLLLRRGTRASFIMRTTLLIALSVLFYVHANAGREGPTLALLSELLGCLVLLVLIREFFLQRSRMLEQQSAMVEIVRHTAIQNARKYEIHIQ